MHDNNPNVAALNMVYQNSKMAIDSIDCLIPKIKNINLKKDLASQMLGYHNLVKNSSSQLYDINHYPEDVNIFNKIPAAASLYIKSAVDCSESHIAEMMIENSTASLIEAQRVFNRCKNLDSEISQIAGETVYFEQKNINKLRNYL